MVNPQKIITMTKLALYDKHEGANDRDANDYFRHDYIYRKNLGTRIAVGVGGLLLLAINWLRVIFVDGVDVFELEIQTHVTEAILFIIALVAVYSLIGTIQGTREYYLVQKRLNRYLGLLRFLENTDTARKPVLTDESEELRERRPAARSETRELRTAQNTSATRTSVPRNEPIEPLDSLRGERDTMHRAPASSSRENDDPLANVTSRAMSSGRPRTQIAGRPSTRPSSRPTTPTPRVRLSTSSSDAPIVRRPTNPPKN